MEILCISNVMLKRVCNYDFVLDDDLFLMILFLTLKIFISNYPLYKYDQGWWFIVCLIIRHNSERQHNTF